MIIYGAILDGIEGKLIEVESDLNPGLAKSIRILGARGIAIDAAAATCIRVLPSALPEGMEAKGSITVGLIPQEGGNRGESLALPIGIRAYLALMLCEIPEPVPPKSGATEDEITAYNEKLNLIKQLATQQAKILRHVERDNSEYLLIGGIHLDGRLYAPERGLMGLISCAKNGMKVIIPDECADYVNLVKGYLKMKKRVDVDILKASTFDEAVKIISGQTSGEKVKPGKGLQEYEPAHMNYHDFEDIEGQEKAKYALEVAAAGGHNVLLWGPMGEGKSTLANAILGVLPELTMAEMVELNKIYTAIGMLKPNECITRRPFRPIPAKVTIPALIGGGQYPQPGEVSKAHGGVLMIDEFNFMDSNTQEQLRVPLQSGCVDVPRLQGKVQFPARFTLIATMNPCKCSYYGEYECSICGNSVGNINGKCQEHPNASTIHRCICSNHKTEVEPYQNFSAPLLNRIDIRIQTVSVNPDLPDGPREPSREIQKRVINALNKQKKRYEKFPDVRRNAEIENKHIKQNIIEMDETAKSTVRDIRRKYRLNTRSYVKVCAIARTIADLKNRNSIIYDDIISAHQLMGSDRDVFKVRKEAVDFTDVPKGDPKKVRQALKVLAERVGEEMLSRRLTVNRVAREAGISPATLKSILEGNATYFAKSARSLSQWLSRQSKKTK